MDGVVTVMKSGGQYQVVIGNHVGEVYADVCEVAGISDKAPSSDESEKKKNLFDASVWHLSLIQTMEVLRMFMLRQSVLL